MTLGCCFSEQLSSKTAGARKGLIVVPCADGAPGEGMKQWFLIQGRRAAETPLLHINAARR
jgi:hypothetical protein